MKSVTAFFKFIFVEDYFWFQLFVLKGTHNLTVEANVVYDIMGGAIFIEDGIETNNLIQYNLAVFVRQSTSLLNDDVTPGNDYLNKHCMKL